MSNIESLTSKTSGLPLFELYFAVIAV